MSASNNPSRGIDCLKEGPFLLCDSLADNFRTLRNHCLKQLPGGSLVQTVSFQAQCFLKQHMPSGRDTFIRTGLPLIGLVVGGWLGISWILEGRFEIKVGCYTADKVWCMTMSI